MSLATTGGGGFSGAGMGGVTLAHQVNSVSVQPPPQANTSTGSTATGVPPPSSSASALGADLVDKSQGLTLKNVKNVSHLPIVAIDLHGTDPYVALFPKKPDDPSKGVPPLSVSKIGTDIMLQVGDVSHKTLRKYLNKSKSYASLKADCISSKAQNAVIIKKPHRWLGIRRVKDVPEFVRNGILVEESSGPEISEEVLQGVGTCISNSTLDGSAPIGDDFDRVVFKVRVHESKKTTSILPEEAVEMIIQQAKCLVAAKIKADPNDEEIEDYPCAVALPSWAYHDAAVEAMMDAVGSGSVLVQRNVAALAGALLPSLDGKKSSLLERLNTVFVALQKQNQIRMAKNPDAKLEEDMTVLVFGLMEDGIEMTAIQISSANLDNVSCLFGVFKVVSNVSYHDQDPISKIQSCAVKLEEAIEAIAPEIDGPSAIIFCGTTSEQKLMAKQWEKAKNEEWTKVPLFVTAEDCISKGAAVLGAVSHGRLTKIEQNRGQKSRAGLAIRVQNVAPVAIGIQMNYHGGDNEKWTPVKVIFDFDRQIPAGPSSMDLSAAECAVYRSGKGEGMTDEEFLKETKLYEGAKGIPKREEAALNFSTRILQRWTRDGEWKQVGDNIEPLVIKNENKDGSITRIGCESMTWELSLGVTGMITTALVGERVSVTVATQSARNSAIRYYLGILFAILFFGGFMFKSYWDEYVLNRDTDRLLAYYKHVVPGSYQDGDINNARYTCYKYRNKKAKLWRSLEKKYGIPVLTTKEYEMMEQEKGDASPTTEQTPDNDGETVDLDADAEKEESAQDEPDL